MIVFRVFGRTPAGLRARDFTRLASALEKEVPRKKQGEVGVRFVSAKEIKRLNRVYRGKNNVTDVLSFGSPTSLGDLAVCASFAKQEARRRGISPREECLRLLAHGALHLAGWDHETERDEAAMFKKQERAVSRVL